MSYPMSLCSTENLQEEAFLQHGAQGVILTEEHGQPNTTFFSASIVGVRAT